MATRLQAPFAKLYSIVTGRAKAIADSNTASMPLPSSCDLVVTGVHTVPDVASSGKSWIENPAGVTRRVATRLTVTVAADATVPQMVSMTTSRIGAIFILRSY